MSTEAWSELLEFWFGDVGPDGQRDTSKDAIYWGGGPALDEELRAKFGDLHRAAERGQLDAWADSPRGRLALIVLLDQLSRNLSRDTREMYRNDETALALAEDGIARGDDHHLPPAMRVFFYMPFMHSEELDCQLECERLLEELCEAVPEEHRDSYANYHRFAVAHRKIVEGYGRFPHRNAILGRETTAEEAEFLKQPDSSF